MSNLTNRDHLVELTNLTSYSFAVEVSDKVSQHQVEGFSKHSVETPSDKNS